MSVTALRLEELKLGEFRCFERLDFRPEAGTNFLIGANAQGKTSILEAICAVTRLQSPRTTSLADLVREGGTGFGVSAQLAHAHLQFRYEPPKRTLRLDSVEQTKPADYLQVARVAWFSNDDLELVRGPGARRRRFLDFVCSQIEPGYLRALRRYERALRSRNALLREARPRAEVAAFDSGLVENGDFIGRTREATVQALAPLLAGAAGDISGRDEGVACRYVPGAAGSLAEALPASAVQEARLRQTVVGPHRDDVELEMGGRAAARFASEGQQRTLAVGLKLAQTRLLLDRSGQAPLLLIDDVFGELDVARRANLLRHLPGDSQRFITTTHLDWLESAGDAAIFGVRFNDAVVAPWSGR